ncbi:hypothetical protein EGC86_10145 [Shewanella frigidimarina]|nr:hypothetical protein EGC86_10145 [Shewanella frigidimarina]
MFFVLYLWPAATNVVARRPHQSKGVKRILGYESAFANRQHSGNFFCFLTKQQQRKITMKINPVLDFVYNRLQPLW